MNTDLLNVYNEAIIEDELSLEEIKGGITSTGLCSGGSCLGYFTCRHGD